MYTMIANEGPPVDENDIKIDIAETDAHQSTPILLTADSVSY